MCRERTNKKYFVDSVLIDWCFFYLAVKAQLTRQIELTARSKAEL